MKTCADEDELKRIEDPSLAEAASAMIKDAGEMMPVWPSRVEDGVRVYTLRFKNDGHLMIRCSLDDDKPVGFEHIGVKFERLGTEIFVSSA